MISQSLKALDRSDRLTEPPANAISHHRIPDLLGDREPEPGTDIARFSTSVRLQGEGFRLPPTSARGALKFGAATQAPQRGGVIRVSPRRRVQRRQLARLIVTSRRRRRAGSRRQALAAARAARVENLAAANGLHAGAEAVAALANELAGLKSPLHESRSKLYVLSRRPSGPTQRTKPDLVPQRLTPRAEPEKRSGGKPPRGRAYRRYPGAKSMPAPGVYPNFGCVRAGPHFW